jgi:hypothetical protein
MLLRGSCMTDWIMVILTLVYVVATIAICYFSYQSAKASREQTMELKHQYDAENRPYITYELIYEKRTFFGIRFSNHGKRIANHVIIQLDQGFLDSLNEPNIQHILEEQKGRECIIGIGQHYDLYFGTNKYRGNKNKVLLSGYISYSDGTKQYKDDFAINTEKYAVFFSVNSDSDDFLSAIKTQNDKLEKISRSLSVFASKTRKKQEDEDE